MEFVDLLIPPQFIKNGEVKSREQAVRDGNWIGVGNLWIVQDLEEPSIIYQQRNQNVSWSPGKLAVAVGGHYRSGEDISGIIREAREELGKEYQENQLTKVGRRLYVGMDSENREKHNVVDIFIVKDNSDLKSFTLDGDEVCGIVICPIKELYNVHEKKNYTFHARGINSDKVEISTLVNYDSFSYNFDNYHFRMIDICKQFLNGKIQIYR